MWIDEALAAFQASKVCAEDWPLFTDTLRLVRGNEAGRPTEFELVCRWYAPHLDQLYKDAKTRDVDLLQLRRSQLERVFATCRFVYDIS